jgi:HEAT repeat protein
MSNEPNTAQLLADLWSDDHQTVNEAVKAMGHLTDADQKNQVFAELIKMLHDEKPAHRLRAVMALGILGDKRAVEHLIETIEDHDDEFDPQMIEARFEVLAVFKDPRAVKPLVANIHRVDYKQAWSLNAFGDEAVDPMIEALKDPKDYTRWQAAYWLGNKHNTRAVQPLIALLTDPDPRIRGQVIASLGWIGSPEAIPHLGKLVYDTDAETRKSVAYALGKIHNPQVLAFLQQLANDDELDVRTEALASIEGLQKES